MLKSFKNLRVKNRNILRINSFGNRHSLNLLLQNGDINEGGDGSKKNKGGDGSSKSNKSLPNTGFTEKYVKV